MRAVKNIGKLFICLFLIVGLGVAAVGCSKNEQQSAPNQAGQGTGEPGQNSGPGSDPSGADPGTDPGADPALPPDPADVSRTAALLRDRGIPVLYYHSVMIEEGNELRMPPEKFDQQMAFLRDNGYESVSLAQLYAAAYEGGVLPEKPFVITFDDGYEDNYTNAFPILKKHGFTAAVFMITAYIDGGGFLSWEQLRALTAAGWEIENHTVNHLDLTTIDEAALLAELRFAKEQLEAGLGTTVRFVAYPYGVFNAGVIQAVRDTGHQMALTTLRGWMSTQDDPWHVKRVYCYATMSLDEFARRVQNPNY